MSKMPMLDKQLYLHNKFVIEKWVNRHHFFTDEKNLQKFGLARGFISCLIKLLDYSKSIFGVTID